jgi:hypothetical protein
MPSHTRNWTEEQSVLPEAIINGNSVTIRNVRNFTYRTANDYTSGYYDDTYNVDDLKKVYFVHVPFARHLGAAHTFISFEFEHNQFLAISVEARRQKGESYSPLRGLFNSYEIMYVVADERDAIALRTNHRKNKVYVYPLKNHPVESKKLFLHIMEEINTLRSKPEFYNTLFNNCTNRITWHMNELVPGSVPWNIGLLFNVLADKHLFNIGLIDTQVKDFKKVRELHHINKAAEQYGNGPDFSVKIRQQFTSPNHELI